MKKLVAVFLSFVMLLTLAMPAMAAEGSTTIYFDNTAGWATVNAYASDAENNVYLGQWPGTAMTYVEGNIWSVAVPTGATTIIFNDGSNQTTDLAIPTDGSNLYTYNSGWSAYTPAPKTEGDVTASYTPTAAITGVSLIVDDVEYSSGSVTLTSANAVQLKVYGTNLNYGTTSNQVMFKDGYVVPMGSGYAWVFSDDGTSATYSMEVDDFSNVTTMYTLRYSNDNESTWNNSDVSVIYSSGEETTYTITVVESSNGTVVADKETAAVGEIVTLTITPNVGYELSELTITYTDAEGTGAFGVNENNSFTMPASDVTITATFVEDTATETPRLTITIDGITYTNENTSADNPALMYSNSDAAVTVYGENLTAGVSGYYGSYDSLKKFNDISSDGTSATGSVSSTTWSLDTLYEICYTIDGTEKLSSGVYVQRVSGNKPGTYDVNVNYTTGGRVSQNLTTAAENDLVTLTVNTDYGYKLSSLTVSDGTNEIETTKVDDTTYTFTMPASEVTVTPVFEEVTVARVTGFKLTVDGKDYTEGTARVTADSQSVSVTLTGTDLNLMTTCTLSLYENVTFTNGEANVAVSDDGTSAVLTIDPTSFTTAFSAYITYQLAGDELVVPGAALSYLTDTGTDLTAIYFKNTGGWETIQADFYDQNRGFLSTVTLTLVPGETDIYSTTEIPAYADQVVFRDGTYVNGTSWMEIPMAADGTDQYNPDSNTWTKFTATQHVTNSFEITWGSMAFTYSDAMVTLEDGTTAEKGWYNDVAGGGTVTVKNTGAATFTASAAYASTTTDYGTITGTLGDAQELSADTSGTFTLTLSGKPTKAIPAGTKIGEVTITINEAAEG